MMASNQGTTARFFDRYSSEFDGIYGNKNGLINHFANRLFRQTMLARYQKTLANCRPIANHTVLDVGCGPGHYSVALATEGASAVLGIDFAQSMVRLASQRAAKAGVASRCSFVEGDFVSHQLTSKFDYVVVMGFMDYARDPALIVSRVAALVRKEAFFSFPAAGGFLAWQRQLRYRRRCELYLYTMPQIGELMAQTSCPYLIEVLERDYYVTLSGPSESDGETSGGYRPVTA